MPALLTVDPLSDPRWQRLVDSSAEAMIFHHPAWLGLVGGHYRFGVHALCVADDQGALLAGLPLAHVRSRLTGERLVAVPFSDRCPPLQAAGAAPDVLHVLARGLAAEHERRGIDVHVHDRIEGLPEAWIVRDAVEHRLPLESDPDEVRRRYARGQIRRGIARARREGVRIVRRTDREALDAFYALHLQTRRRQGVPIQPKRFISALERLFADGLGFVLVATWRERPIAAAVFLESSGTLTYKYGASDRPHLDKRPNNLLFDEAVRLGCERGAHTLDFGKTDVANAGLRAFKRAWGSEERELPYTILSRRPPRDGHGRAERLVAACVRRGPAVTGRLIGSALYRHAA